jgi:DNA repair exonuclease SbcCD nuclease subunit
MTPKHKPARRILHTSDLHLITLNGPACKNFEAVINLGIKSRAELLIIAGDLFDRYRIADDLLEYVGEQINRLPIPVIILPGNHDCLVPQSVYNKKDFWQRLDNVHIISSGSGETLNFPALNISVWGKPIDSDLDDVYPLKGMPQPKDNGTWNIAVAHGFFVRSLPNIPNSYSFTEAEIQGTNWNYIALGHVPLFRMVCNDPITCYSGAPTSEGTAALVELDEEKGVQVKHIL